MTIIIVLILYLREHQNCYHFAIVNGLISSICNEKKIVKNSVNKNVVRIDVWSCLLYKCVLS